MFEKRANWNRFIESRGQEINFKEMIYIIDRVIDIEWFGKDIIKPNIIRNV